MLFLYFICRQACDIDEVTFSTAFIDTELRHNPVDEESILKLAQAASNLLRKFIIIKIKAKWLYILFKNQTNFKQLTLHWNCALTIRFFLRYFYGKY